MRAFPRWAISIVVAPGRLTTLSVPSPPSPARMLELLRRILQVCSTSALILVSTACGSHSKGVRLLPEMSFDSLQRSGVSEVQIESYLKSISLHDSEWNEDAHGEMGAIHIHQYRPVFWCGVPGVIRAAFVVRSKDSVYRVDTELSYYWVSNSGTLNSCGDSVQQIGAARPIGGLTLGSVDSMLQQSISTRFRVLHRSKDEVIFETATEKRVILHRRMRDVFLNFDTRP